MSSSSSIRSRVESIMLEAERQALKVLAPTARKIIVVLKSLYKGELSEEEILADCLLLYHKCKSVKPVLRYLEELGVVTWKPWTQRYVLTEYGKAVAEALMDIVVDIHRLIETSLKNKIDLVDLYVQLVTPAMSMIEIAMGARSKGERMLALTIHAYISLLLASVLSILAREDPRFTSILSELEKMVVGEESTTGREDRDVVE